MADQHAVASGEDEGQHDESILRDIHGEREPETAHEEQPDKLWKQYMYIQGKTFQILLQLQPCLSCNYPASGEGQDRTQPVLVQNSGHVDDDTQNFALNVFLRDGWTKESLHQ